MNLAFLKTFLTVVETGNLNRAAERLHVTQSTVTARLDALEDALGRTLLLRARKGARLTRAGFELLPYAEMLVEGWAQARSAINLPAGFSAMFSFACEFDLWQGEGRDWLYRHRTTHPDIAFEARPGRRAEIVSWLGSGLTDAALVTEPLAGPGILSRHFAEQRLRHVATTAHRGEDWRETYVFVDLGTDFRRSHAQAMPETKTANMTFSVCAWALDHLLTFGGSAYLPDALVAPIVAEGRLHVWSDGPVLTRSLYFAYREGGEERFPWLSHALPESAPPDGEERKSRSS